MSNFHHLGIIVLAAGGSRRLGRPKQLLKIGDEPLLRRVVRTVLSTGSFEPVVVVTGARASDIEATLDGLPLVCERNPDWASGMASSLRAGVLKLLSLAPQLDGAFVVLGDQPLLSPDLLVKFSASFAHHWQIIATQYGEVIGAPALFGRDYFGELQELTGDVGARKVIERHRENTTLVISQVMAVDLDTAEDVQKFGQDWPAG